MRLKCNAYSCSQLSNYVYVYMTIWCHVYVTMLWIKDATQMVGGTCLGSHFWNVLSLLFNREFTTENSHHCRASCINKFMFAVSLLCKACFVGVGVYPA